MHNVWIKQANQYDIGEASAQLEKLPPGIYKVEYNEMFNSIYLVRVADKFDMPAKVYGFEEEFVERMIKTYGNTTGNMGVLLNGLKGTGKTVTAKQFCNHLDLPVLIVAKNLKELPTFLNKLQQDVIVFFDEYEKMYNNYDSSILTVMDGVLDNEFRKIFLLTTNDTHINDNMLQRPSRIRYHKTYGDLTIPQIKEIIKDNLKYPQFEVELESFISELEIITVDIVRSIVEEVNIHNQGPDKFQDVFNVKRMDNIYDIKRVATGEKSLPVPETEYMKAQVSPRKINVKAVGALFKVNNYNVGVIKEIVGPDMIKVESFDEYAEGSDARAIVTYKLEKSFFVHHSYLI